MSSIPPQEKPYAAQMFHQETIYMIQFKNKKQKKTNYQRQLLLRFVTPKLIHYTIQILNNALDNNASASNASVYLMADRQRGDFFLSYAISND